jgi:hypothetical protein
MCVGCVYTNTSRCLASSLVDTGVLDSKMNYFFGHMHTKELLWHGPPRTAGPLKSRSHGLLQITNSKNERLLRNVGAFVAVLTMLLGHTVLEVLARFPSPIDDYNILAMIHPWGNRMLWRSSCSLRLGEVA